MKAPYGTPRARLPFIQVSLARELAHHFHVVLARERVHRPPRGELGDLLLREALLRLQPFGPLVVPFPHSLDESISLFQIFIQRIILPLGLRVDDLLRALRSTFLLLSELLYSVTSVVLVRSR